MMTVNAGGGELSVTIRAAVIFDPKRASVLAEFGVLEGVQFDAKSHVPFALTFHVFVTRTARNEICPVHRIPASSNIARIENRARRLMGAFNM